MMAMESTLTSTDCRWEISNRRGDTVVIEQETIPYSQRLHPLWTDRYVVSAIYRGELRRIKVCRGLDEAITLAQSRLPYHRQGVFHKTCTRQLAAV